MWDTSTCQWQMQTLPYTLPAAPLSSLLLPLLLLLSLVPCRCLLAASAIYCARNNKLLLTTATELKAIIPPAALGFSARPMLGSNAPAAKGIPTTLYTRAHARFCLILLSVACPSVMQSTTCDKRSPMSTTDAASPAMYQHTVTVRESFFSCWRACLRPAAGCCTGLEEQHPA